MVRFGIILMLVCLTASLILSFTYKKTNPLIIIQKEKEEKEALSTVYPEGENFKKLDNHYLVYKDEKPIGFVIRVSAKGYAGPIEMLVGFNQEGTIQGVNVLEQKETPGLGARISEVKYGEKEPWFLSQFKHKNIKELNLSKINAISGATISSRAIIEGVRKNIEEFLKGQTLNLKQ
ncbi:MAG: RnfABCDGE type electron transport complex subunit G [Candidatus Omnitrophica bacterium]|nr:RnfABCDGE type electron transport complex subunit G [Candidatus Omnitrophota bacterium]